MDSVKYQILILKSPSEDEDEDPYITALAELKIPAALIPTLEFQFVNLDHLDACLNVPEKYSGLLLVSPRCVQSVIKCFCKETDVGRKEEWIRLPTFVIGETTARLARKNLPLTFSGSSSGNMKNLLQTIDPRSVDKPLLMPCGNLNKAIPEEKYYNIEKVVVYETRPHSQLGARFKELLRDEEVLSLIVFFSPSGVDYALPHIQNISKTKNLFLALGPTTSKAMEEHNLKVSAVCKKPNPESLVHEIRKILQC